MVYYWKGYTRLEYSTYYVQKFKITGKGERKSFPLLIWQQGPCVFATDPSEYQTVLSTLEHFGDSSSVVKSDCIILSSKTPLNCTSYISKQSSYWM